MTWRTEMQKAYEEILRLEPTYEEIEAYAKDCECGNGVLTYTKNDDNPLTIRLHDTWKLKLGGHLHIDVVSGEFHLMLDRDNAPDFVKFLKEKRNTP